MALDMQETSFSHIGGSSTCEMTASETWSINWVHKMMEEHPNEIKVDYTNPDGSMIVEIPFECMKYIRFPSKRDMTDEQREAVKERGKRLAERRMKSLLEKNPNYYEEKAEKEKLANQEKEEKRKLREAKKAEKEKLLAEKEAEKQEAIKNGTYVPKKRGRKKDR